MRRKLTWVMVVSAVAVAGALYVENAWATPSSGFVGTTLAMGHIGNIDVFNSVTPANEGVWLSMQKTKGQSDLYVQTNTWAVNGSTGWHSHPGHSLIIVTAGAVTDYEGDDPNCTPHVYTQGMAFADPGGNHVHLIRNEGSVPASTVAVQLIPRGAPRRVDEPAPGTCGF